jgi:hypothetical protein
LKGKILNAVLTGVVAEKMWILLEQTFVLQLCKILEIFSKVKVQKLIF